ncbi:MAG TPA: RsmD family RNA methyltransferase [Spirochaetia bacterium]|nr:RsmD family RNA methyltransferase [Spirochaetia bacterium]
MRITGGRYVGRTITCPPGVIRPAMDRMRESLFALLGSLTDKSFLDLFSGSGLIALEAASRGAARVEAVEKDQGKRSIILKNFAIADERIDLHLVPVERYLMRAKPEWDFIFVDPPFAYRYKEQLLIWIATRGLLGSSGLLLMHHPAPEQLPEKVDPESVSVASARALVRVDRRTYGGSAVDFYRPSADD